RDPSLGGPDLEHRFHDATFAPWLVRTGAILIRPTKTGRFWSVWQGAWFLGAGLTPHAAISRARRYRLPSILAPPPHPLASLALPPQTPPAPPTGSAQPRESPAVPEPRRAAP